MCEMVALSANDPLMKAWETYKLTPHFANTRKWATDIDWLKQDASNADGQLWAAFEAGWRSRGTE